MLSRATSNSDEWQAKNKSAQISGSLGATHGTLLGETLDNCILTRINHKLEIAVEVRKQSRLQHDIRSGPLTWFATALPGYNGRMALYCSGC